MATHDISKKSGIRYEWSCVSMVSLFLNPVQFISEQFFLDHEQVVYLKKKMQDQVKEIFERHYGIELGHNDLEIINESRNFIYRVYNLDVTNISESSVIVKIVNSDQENPLGNVEYNAYDWLSSEDDTFNIPKCLLKGMLSKDCYYYLILEDIKGRTLLELMDELVKDEIFCCQAMSQIVNFIKKCSLKSVKDRRFGALDYDMRGRYQNYQEFISSCLQEQNRLLNGCPTHNSQDSYVNKRTELLLPYLEDLTNFFMKNPLLNETNPHLVPIDFNPANFIWCQESSLLVVIDLEVFVGADEMFALGGVMANWFNMPAFKVFEKCWGEITDLKRACAFALLRCLNIMIHLAINTNLNLTDVTPFGNTTPFIQLMETFRGQLKDL